jgi:hypothetical protein
MPATVASTAPSFFADAVPLNAARAAIKAKRFQDILASLDNSAEDYHSLGAAFRPIRGSSIYVKDGNAWKWSFGINLPAAITNPDQS